MTLSHFGMYFHTGTFQRFNEMVITTWFKDHTENLLTALRSSLKEKDVIEIIALQQNNSEVLKWLFFLVASRRRR